MKSVLRLERVFKSFDGPAGSPAVDALNGVDLRVDRGEFVAVIGPSGSGKTTLLQSIARVTKPTGGIVRWRGAEIQGLEGRALRAARRSIAVVFQHFNLVPRLSVLENVWCGRLGALSPWQSLTPRAADLDHARACLKRVGLDDRAMARADQLSGGQRQRVAIARALCQEAELLLADEPVSSLDPPLARGIMRDLRAANHDLGITVICNLHDLSLAREFATRIVGLRGGRIVFDGPPAALDAAAIERVYGKALAPDPEVDGGA